MAQFDSSIYRGVPAIDLSQATEGFERGMKLGDMVRQRKTQELEAQKQSAIKEAYQAGNVTNPDGSTSFDQSITLGKLSGIDPRERAKAEAEFRQQDIFKKQDEATITLQESMKALQNPAYYPEAVKTLVSRGYITADAVPPQFDESFVKSAAARALSAKEYLSNMNQQQESAARLAETQQNNDFRRQEVGLRRLERQDAIDAKREEKQLKLTTPYGLANSEQDAKDIKDADEEMKSLAQNIETMISLRTKHNGGAVFAKDDIAVGKQASRDALLAYKNLKKLGVLSQSDQEIVEAIIPADPLEYNDVISGVSGQDPTKAKLSQFKENKEKEFETKITNRVRNSTDGVELFRKQNQTETTTAKPPWAK